MKMLELGVDIRTGTEVVSVKKVEDLFEFDGRPGIFPLAS